jgi:hypothetical protein
MQREKTREESRVAREEDKGRALGAVYRGCIQSWEK